MDRNLLHISFESGMLEDPWFDASAPEHKDMYKLSVSPEDAPDRPDYLELLFEKGNCVGLVHPELWEILDALGYDGNGDDRLSPVWVMRVLNRLGGRNGVGRVDMVENRFVGMKSRGVYETPGGAILHFAHRQMESLTMDREVMHLRDSLIPKVQRSGLQRLLVRARAGGAAGACHGIAEERDGNGPSEALQGQYHRRGPKEPGQPLQPAYRHDGGRSDKSL